MTIKILNDIKVFEFSKHSKKVLKITLKKDTIYNVIALEENRVVFDTRMGGIAKINLDYCIAL